MGGEEDDFSIGFQSNGQGDKGKADCGFRSIRVMWKLGFSY